MRRFGIGKKSLPFVIIMIIFQWNNCWVWKYSCDFNTKCVQSINSIAAVLCGKSVCTAQKDSLWGDSGRAYGTHSSNSSMGKIDKCQCYVVVHITAMLFYAIIIEYSDSDSCKAIQWHWHHWNRERESESMHAYTEITFERCSNVCIPITSGMLNVLYIMWCETPPLHQREFSYFSLAKG